MADTNSRIMSRRERRENKSLNKLPKEEVVEKVCGIPTIQIESNKRVVQKTQDSALTLLRNIKVGLDERTIHKQTQDNLDLSRLDEKVKQNKITETDTYYEINQVMHNVYKIMNPNKIYAELMQEKKRLNDILGDKERVIGELKEHLKQADERYVKNLETQAKDFDILMERIGEQTKRVSNVQREEIIKLKNIHNSRRMEMIEAHLESYNKALEERKEYEDNYLRERLSVLDSNDDKLEEMRENDNEEYIIVKEKLESDIHELQQKLQHVKAVFQLNQEKLEYNYQVLRKRDEENALMKSKQKRRLTKAHDVLLCYKNKLKVQEKRFREENETIGNDYRRVLEQIRDFQKMAKSIIKSDERKIYDIWRHNYSDCSKRLSDIFKVAEIFFDQQLCMEYKPPLMEDIQSPKTTWNKPTSSPSVEIVRKILSLPESSEIGIILEMLYADSDYLIEKRLSNVLKTEESPLIGIDAVLSALNITEQDQINHICDYIVNYDKTHMLTDQLVCDVYNNNYIPRNIQLHHNYILEILKNYMQEEHKHYKNKLYSSTTLSDLLSDFDYNSCWDIFSRAADEEIWGNMIQYFEKYRTVLQKRVEMTRLNYKIEKQNYELSSLLKEYYNSKINTVLQIPPPLTIQFDKS